MVGNVSSRLTERRQRDCAHPADIGMAAAIYIAGACLGALFFGRLTDRFGRRNLFILTLAVYLTATVATAFAFAPWFSPHSVLHRLGHRRGIRGHQFSHRRVDPRACARSGGSGDQRDLLGWDRPPERAVPSSCWTRRTSRPTSDGGSHSASAPSSAFLSCWSGVTFPKAHGGCSSTDATRKQSGSSARSKPTFSEKPANRFRNHQASHSKSGSARRFHFLKSPGSHSCSIRGERSSGWRCLSDRLFSTTA